MATMKVSTLLLEATLLLSSTLANFDLCNRCHCNSDVTSLSSRFINCSSLSLTKVPEFDTWPDFLTGEQNTLVSVLDFEKNQILTLPQFPKLKTVTGMCFRHNAINKILEAAFLHLESLKMLDLSHNELTGEEIRADIFRGPFWNSRYEPLGIVSLHLGHNRIHSLSQRAFEHLSDLEELRLDNNPLRVVDATTEMALAALVSLKVLDLGYTGLQELPDTLTHSFTKLRELYLNGNDFRDVPETLAALGPTLEKLNLNDNPLLSLDENSFLGLSSLKQLNISGCSDLEEVLPGSFAHLASLESLYMAFNSNLSYISPEAFRELKDNWPIRQISLHNNALSSLSEKLLPWNKLEVLDIQENPWRCDCELEWLVERLIPSIRRDNPDHVTDIRCDKPHPLRGEQLMTLNLSLLCAPGDVTRRPTKRGVYIHPFTITMVMISLMLVVLALVAVFRNYCIKKKKNMVVLREVRYTRQVDVLDDDEYS